MISSMTGFGRGESKHNGMVVSAEIRSLNHRFLDVELRLPKSLCGFERELKGIIGSGLSRGKVNATITIKGEEITSAGLTIDKELAATYIKLLNELKDELNIDDSIKLEQLLNFPDIITVDNSKELDDSVWEAVKAAIELAIDDLRDMRLKEGLEIKNDLESRVAIIEEKIVAIESSSKEKSKEEFGKLKKRVEELASSEIINEGRLEMEIALIAEKADITEECIRFKSHNKFFFDLLKNGKSEGRKLNFLVQEMHREANTIGSKANDASIAHLVVGIKEEVEKLREQIQNIE